MDVVEVRDVRGEEPWRGSRAVKLRNPSCEEEKRIAGLWLNEVIELVVVECTVQVAGRPLVCSRCVGSIS